MATALNYWHLVHHSMGLSAVMQKIRWGILLIGVIILLAAAVQNSENVLLKLFFYETQLPVSVLLLVTSTISFLIGALTMGRLIRQKAKAKSKLVPEKPVEPSAPASPKTTPFS
jgi:uncharacterized integral membrane protein